MCLRKKGRFKPARFGYKVMRRSEVNPKWFRSELRGSGRIEQGKWVDEKDFRQHPDEANLTLDYKPVWYPTGWHIFHSLESARDWMPSREHAGYETYCIVKVSIREPVAVGYQDVGRVTVAKQMKILRVVA